MRVVALDPSLTAFAMADSAAPMAPAVLHSRHLRGMQRIQWLHDHVMKACEPADVVVIEGYSFGSKGRAVFDIAELGGVIRYALHCRGATVVEVAPSQLKKLATGSGNAPKDAVLVEAVKRLGFQDSDHNMADALWLLQAALIHYNLPGAVDLPKTHLVALEKISWPPAKSGAAA